MKLLDTCVVSELQKPAGSPAVQSFLDLAPAKSLFLSVITIGEITKGVVLLVTGVIAFVSGSALTGGSEARQLRSSVLDYAGFP